MYGVVKDLFALLPVFRFLSLLLFLDPTFNFQYMYSIPSQSLLLFYYSANLPSSGMFQTTSPVSMFS